MPRTAKPAATPGVDDDSAKPGPKRGPAAATPTHFAYLVENIGTVFADAVPFGPLQRDLELAKDYALAHPGWNVITVPAGESIPETLRAAGRLA